MFYKFSILSKRQISKFKINFQLLFSRIKFHNHNAKRLVELFTFCFSKRGVLNEENIAWLEQVFRENVGKGKEEFTLDEFKKIVPSKNVSSFL